MRLLMVEWRRFFARGVTRFIAVALLLGVVATGIGLAVISSRDQAAARSKAVAEQSQYQGPQAQARVAQECRAHFAANPSDLPPGATVDDVCPQPQGQNGQTVTTSMEYSDPRFSFHDHAIDLARSGMVIGCLLALLLGATFIGAEWQQGTMASLLTWEPRRLRVMAAKIAAAGTGAAALAVAFVAGMLGVGALAASLRGTMGHAGELTANVVYPPSGDPVITAGPPVQGSWDHHALLHTAALTGRGVLLVALLAVLATSLAFLTRYTVAAVGVVLGYLVVVELIFGTMLGDHTLRYKLLVYRMVALLNGTATWTNYNAPPGPTGQPLEHVIHALPAGLVLAAVTGVVAIGAAAWFRRRDVT